MSRRDLQLMIMESAGGPVRRVRLSVRWLIASGVVTALSVLLTLAMLVHSVMLSGAARESERVRRENAMIAALVDEITTELPEVERSALRSEMAFSQVWAKSGLGMGPNLLAVGPLEGAVEYDEVGGSLGDPLATGLELTRVKGDAAQMRNTLSDLVDYFNDAEQILSNTPSIRPSDSPWTTSGFGRRRDPMDGRLMMHKGIDIGGYIGAPIVAPADGVVIFAGTRGGYGKTLVLDHGYGYQTHFAHLSGFAASVGDRIPRGQLIAYMGSTGKSTGPHLHYEVRLFGQPLDPVRFILD